MTEQERWEERYRTGETPWDTGRPSSELQRVLQEERIVPCRAVELGSGTGTNAIWLATQGFEVTAVDLSARAIERARAKTQAAGMTVRWIVGDVLDPPDVGKAFGFVFDRGCYHVVRRSDVGAYLATLRTVLAPGASGLVLAGNAREPHDPGPPTVTEEQLREELGQVFDIAWVREFRFDPAEPDFAGFLGWSCFGRYRD